jgi:hypothetical protein
VGKVHRYAIAKSGGRWDHDEICHRPPDERIVQMALAAARRCLPACLRGRAFNGMLLVMVPRNTPRARVADVDAGRGPLMSAEDAERAIVTGQWPDSSE